MRVARLCAGAALCLAALACDNQKSKGAGGPELYAPIAGDSAGGAQPAAKREARRDTVVEGAAINEPEPLQPQAEVAVGMKRELFLATLGGCAERIAFAPARVEGALTTEIFQPKKGDCTEKFEPRRFFVVGGILQKIEPGRDTSLDVAAAPANVGPPPEVSNK